MHLLAPNPWKIIHDKYELIENDFSMEEVKNEALELKQQSIPDKRKISSSIEPQRITDLIDKIDVYLEEMRSKKDKTEIPRILINYIWGYFRDINPDKEKLKMLALILADHTYHYAGKVMLTDDYTLLYFASVITELWNTLQSRGVDTFYILSNELREGEVYAYSSVFCFIWCCSCYSIHREEELS